MRKIDLRSDTVTKPTLEMLDSIKDSLLGDDVYGEDPTVNKLERLGAELLGKEDSLLVTSGTQGNQVAVLSHTQRGDEVIVDRYSHIFQFELGALAALCGVQPIAISGIKGKLDINEIISSIRPLDIHCPTTSLLCLENPHNSAGGVILPLDYLEDIKKIKQKYQIKTHLDGARLFNAAAALKVLPSLLAEPFDSVQICLSKGLCAPVGSLLVGSREFIKKARKYRKMLGGGMRQAGVIAAPGIIALTKMTERLYIDHQNAYRLAKELNKIPYLFIDISTIQTNMVYAEIENKKVDAFVLFTELETRGILIDVLNQSRIRLVTHNDVSNDDITKVIEVMNRFFHNLS